MVQQHKQRKATLAVVRSTDKLGLALAVAAAAAYYLGARSRGDEHGREETNGHESRGPRDAEEHARAGEACG